MTNLTSTLTVGLVDNVSKPARSVAQALKDAENKIKEVSKAMAGTGSTDRLQQSLVKLGATAKDIKTVAQAWEEYRKAANLAADSSKWTKDEARNVRQWENTQLSALRAVESERKRFYAAQSAAVSKAKDEQKKIRREQSVWSHNGVGGAVTGALVGAFTAHTIYVTGKEVIQKGAAYQHERVALQNSGRSAEEMREIEKAARETIRSVPTSTLTENLKVINETVGAFGDLHHAIENLPFMQKTSSILHAAAGDKIQGDAGELGNKLARFFELRGTAGDTKVFQREAGEMARAMVFTRGNFNPDEMLNFAQQAKGSLQNYSERFMSKIMPSLVTEIGGERAGTAANAWTNTIMGKARDKKQAEEWSRLGLIDPKKVLSGKNGPIGWKAGAVKDTDLALRDPLKWTEDTLIPLMQKAGIDVDDSLSVTKELGTLYRNSNANQFAQMITQIRNRQRLHKDEANINAAGTPDEIYQRNLKTDPTVAADALKASLDSLSTAVSSPGMKAAAGVISGIAEAMQKLADTAADHPIASMTAGGVMGGAALGGAGYMTYQIATGFGLPAAAGELTGAAAALDAAAAKLGVAGNLPGGPLSAPAAAAAGGAWPLLGTLGTVALFGAGLGLIAYTGAKNGDMTGMAPTTPDGSSGPLGVPFKPWMPPAGKPLTVGLPPPTPENLASADQATIDLKKFEDAKAAAKETGDVMKESLDVTLTPTVDTSSLSNAVTLARTLNAELAKTPGLITNKVSKAAAFRDFGSSPSTGHFGAGPVQDH